LESFRRWLTRPRPTRYLVLILVGSWFWLAIAEEKSLGRYLLATGVAIVSVWSRFGAEISKDLAASGGNSRKRRDRDKRDFLGKIATISALPIVITFYVDFRIGLRVLALVLIMTTIHVVLAPGKLLTEGSKRKLRRWLAHGSTSD